MEKAKKGDTVRVHYRGKLKDGTVFDSSFGKEPLEFVLGHKEIKQTFDRAIEGMKVGEQKVITFSPEEGYGEYHESFVTKIQKKRFPDHVKPRIGMRLNVPAEDGQSIRFRVIDMTEDDVTLDANHPLAGKHLIYEVQLLEIVNTL
ncbi:MAG: peptidylprolyl isomerase [Candidatus Aureabacteria bacterium]|nr:peptidylprolyl isomerase [Candidatus Auribacterota bacterium]